ncbi:hypothetical protein BYT27DRAFT_7022037, partial [Phlegmacium glaucopus]
ANSIVILGYPSHCTHVLQGLDVVSFAKMKNEFRREIQKFEIWRSVGKGEFSGVLGPWGVRSSDPWVKLHNAEFGTTGVCPFNP